MTNLNDIQRWYDGSNEKEFFKGMNHYEYAIKYNETEDFYFGKGKYFWYNIDFGVYDYTANFSEMELYAKLYGNDILLFQFKKDISNLSNKRLTIKEFTVIFNFIFVYFIVYSSEKLELPFGELSQQVKERYRFILKQFELKFQNIEVNQLNEDLKKENEQLEHLHDLISRFYERFKVSVF